MKIVLVIDQFDQGNNGTTITARRYAEQLRRRGHTVKVLAAGGPEPDKITVPKHHIPFFQGLIESQGMYFAKPVDEAYYQAFRDADVIHFYMPFRFCRRGESLARQMHIPTVAAFHVQPENITSTLFLGRCKMANEWLYRWFYRNFYNRFDFIHCPSKFIADQLEQHNYGAECRVISNGVDAAFVPPEEPPVRNDGTFRILMIGRLSREKRQDLIIKAAALSRHRDKIQLIFAGKGPRLGYTKFISRKLPRKPVFGFYTKEELVKLIYSCDLYVHASDAEIEGISCMEAFSCGLVPVISDSPLSATNQFALDERSCFKAGDAQSLADRIDYWIEHPEEKAELSKKYADYGNSMRVEQCVTEAEKLYTDAIAHWKSHGYRHVEESGLKRFTHPNPAKVAAKYGTNGGHFTHFLSNFISPILWFLDTVFWGFSIEGRENLKAVDGGAVTVMNHIHPMDCTMVKLATFPRPIHFISLAENLELPFVGWLTYAAGAVPLPDSTSALLSLERRLEDSIRGGEWIHYYAEGMLVRYHDEVRPFRKGAFLAAVRANCPVIPMHLTCEKPHGIRRLWRHKPFMHLTVGAPLYPDPSLKRKQAVEDLMLRTQEAVSLLGTAPAVQTCEEKGA
ncbi:MAG: glycosyltransferase [Candidatus Limivicinus sp.]